VRVWWGGVCIIYSQTPDSSSSLGIDPINLAVFQDRHATVRLLLDCLRAQTPLHSPWVLNNRQALFRCRSVEMARVLIEVRRHRPQSRRQRRAPLPVRQRQVQQMAAQPSRPAQVVLDLCGGFICGGV
jgi:hypothetical protein